MSSHEEKNQKLLQPIGTKNDPVNSPSHYTRGSIEVIDFLESQGIQDFRLANVIKYVARCQYKGSEQEDLEKALWYLRRYLKWKFNSAV